MKSEINQNGLESFLEEVLKTSGHCSFLFHCKEVQQKVDRAGLRMIACSVYCVLCTFFKLLAFDPRKKRHLWASFGIRRWVWGPAPWLVAQGMCSSCRLGLERRFGSAACLAVFWDSSDTHFCVLIQFLGPAVALLHSIGGHREELVSLAFPADGGCLHP